MYLLHSPYIPTEYIPRVWTHNVLRTYLCTNYNRYTVCLLLSWRPGPHNGVDVCGFDLRAFDARKSHNARIDDFDCPSFCERGRKRTLCHVQRVQSVQSVQMVRPERENPGATHTEPGCRMQPNQLSAAHNHAPRLVASVCLSGICNAGPPLIHHHHHHHYHHHNPSPPLSPPPLGMHTCHAAL